MGLEKKLDGQPSAESNSQYALSYTPPNTVCTTPTYESMKTLLSNAVAHNISVIAPDQQKLEKYVCGGIDCCH